MSDSGDRSKIKGNKSVTNLSLKVTNLLPKVNELCLWVQFGQTCYC